MSETETIKGKLTPTGKTLEQFIDDYLDDNKREIPEWVNGDIEEFFRDEFYRSHFLYKGKVYEIESKDYEFDDIYEAAKNDDGTVDFLVRFYNGGCSLDEALEAALKKLK